MDFKKTIIDQITEVSTKLDKKQIRNALNQLDISNVTYSKYLNGDGMKIEVYQKIYDALKNLN